MSENLAALAESRDNNFRIIRLAAASAVIFSHAYVVNMGLSQATWFKEPLYAWTGVTFGDLAVNIFFVTSGFLVSHGLIGGGRALDFIMARVLRIYPGLIVALLVCAFALGPIATNIGVRHYLVAKGTWAFMIYDGLALDPFNLRFGLPGVFAHNPYPDVVNASLWTLPWEIWMYISLLAVAGLRLTGRLFPALLVIILALYASSEFGFGHSSIAFPIVTRFMAFFYVGVAFYRYRNLVPISPKVASAVAAVFLAGSIAIQNRALEPLFVGYMTLFAAYWPRAVVKRWSHGADISYGVYIYAYPLQQAWVWLLGPHNVLLNCALTFPIAAILAFASWRLIEKPALNLKTRLRALRALRV